MAPVKRRSSRTSSETCYATGQKDIDEDYVSSLIKKARTICIRNRRKIGNQELVTEVLEVAEILNVEAIEAPNIEMSKMFNLRLIMYHIKLLEVSIMSCNSYML